MTWADRRRWTNSVLLRPEQDQAITTEARRRRRKREIMEAEARLRRLRRGEWECPSPGKASEESDQLGIIHGVGSALVWW